MSLMRFPFHIALSSLMLFGGFPMEAASFSTVVIDAGHGGHDAGGIPANIIREKVVALDVAQRLEACLDSRGFRTVMTRNDDTFVTLGTRVSIANSQKNSIFISIHFNAAPRLAARGIETFYSSPAGASLAARIQRRLMTTTTGVNRGVKHATFRVLRDTKTRAVLVECGFLTNQEDANLARRAAYRQRLAEQIAVAIQDYKNSL